MIRLRPLPLAALSFAMLLPATSPTASALTATTTFGVSANVIKACVVSATSVAFGTYNPVGAAAANATGTLTVSCTATTSYTTGLSAGTGTGASVTARKMTGGTASNLLAYGLYQDSAHTVNWGNTPGTDTPAAVVGTGLPQTATVYGQIAAGTVGAIDNYTDTITVTVTY
ncbi:Csu type fimbrial protein [Terriglobus roseus]|uniref:Spore coat protein U (SCPU) domain-containing protein n=1 Tax=Terriglobus roseus TaxID=392734 RepID=A0A1H4IUC9_9BACT|nr:spore coat U domain-containing protein [Terriglobus roseus]SEB37607.1 Spore coat protein U (SCPU) domain-containing protein [Terriglobus roseus]